MITMYKLRNSESNNRPSLVEKTQGGILIRFDIKEVTKDEVLMYEYKEFWFALNATNIEEAVNNEGFQLTQQHKNIIRK